MQSLKEFRAVDPVSRFMVCRVFSRASAGNANPGPVRPG